MTCTDPSFPNPRAVPYGQSLFDDRYPLCGSSAESNFVKPSYENEKEKTAPVAPLAPVTVVTV